MDAKLLFILAACDSKRPRAETRRRSSDSDDARSPELRPLSPAPGAETERGVTKRRRNAEAAALAPRDRSGREARPSLSRLGPASAGRALRPRWAQPLSRGRLGAAKHPGRTRSRRKVARVRACARAAARL